MNDQEAKEQLEGILKLLEGRAPKPGAERVVSAVHRGRRRRLTRGLSTVVVAAVVVAGLAFPLGLLSDLRNSTNGAASGGASVSDIPSKPSVEPAYGGSSPAPLTFHRARADKHGWKRLVDPVSGISIEIPDNWSFRPDPKPDISDPRMLFGTGTVNVADGSTPCEWLSRVTADGAVVWLVEWFDVEGLGGSRSDFPSQPATFALTTSYSTGPHDCVEEVPPEYTIPFQASGRFFWFTVAVGSSATSSLISTVTDVLSSVKVQEPPPPAG